MYVMDCSDGLAILEVLKNIAACGLAVPDNFAHILKKKLKWDGSGGVGWSSLEPYGPFKP